MFSSKRRNDMPVVHLSGMTKEYTEESCKQLREMFSELSVEQQSIYIKLFESTVGVITHLAYDRAKEVDLGCKWKMVNENGVTHLNKTMSGATQIYDLEELNNAETGSYVYKTYTIIVKQGLNKLAISIETEDGITDAFNSTKSEKLGYLIKMAIGRLSK